MQTILVVNSKGGCGKTTVTTNIAGYFASVDYRTAIMDYDPQGSSLQWLKLRSHELNSIHGANAAKQKGSMIRSWQKNVPVDTEKLVIDAPAGVDNLMLQEMVRKADFIVIPVTPSPIDIHATADFIKDLFLIGKARANNSRLAIVANRVRPNNSVYEPLERFLKSLKIPLIARLSDADGYINAVAEGRGVYEMEQGVRQEKSELLPLISWLEQISIKSELTGNLPVPDNNSKVVSLSEIRAKYR